MRIPGPTLVLPLLFLTGCAIPPAVTIASLVLDGVSYVSTGKSTTDHAISAFANEDCALLRLVDGKDICDPDGEVLIALSIGNAEDENWNLDPETGSPDPDAITRWGSASELEATVEALPEQPSEVSVVHGTTKSLGQTATAIPALTPGPAGQGKRLRAPVTAISVAAKPPPRGLFAYASPTVKPQEPQLPVRTVRQFTRVTEQDGQITTYAVIGSFQNADNARRMVQLHGKGALIQTIVVEGKTAYRVLVDQPLEQARLEGFSDAWPVRLCAGDQPSAQCGHLVVSQVGVYIETTAN